MKILRLLSLLSVLAIVLVSYMPYPSGAPSPYYYTGSPGDGHNCSQCHGTASTVSGWITSNIPASGYVPGTAYQVTATNTISGSGRYGFEVSPQNATGTLLGTLTAGTNSKLVGSNKWVTHSSASTSISSWTFTWTAPVAGTGDVTFYGSFARSTGSTVKLSTLLVSEQTGGSLPGAAGPITGSTTTCQNSSGTYSVGTIAGATSYVWSVPGGSTITAGQGTTSITVNFGPSAVSGNISVYGTNTTGSGTASDLTVTVNTLPGFTAAISGPSQVDLATVSTSNYSTNGAASAVSYVWDLSPLEAGTIAGTGLTATVTWNPSFLGSAFIKAKAINDCGEGAWSDIRETMVINTTGLDEFAKAGIKMFPSPSNGHFNLEITGTPGTAVARILNPAGLELYSTSIPVNLLTAIDVRLSTGLYILVIETGNETIKKKLLIQK